MFPKNNNPNKKPTKAIPPAIDLQLSFFMKLPSSSLIAEAIPDFHIKRIKQVKIRLPIPPIFKILNIISPNKCKYLKCSFNVNGQLVKLMFCWKIYCQRIGRNGHFTTTPALPFASLIFRILFLVLQANGSCLASTCDSFYFS